MKILFVTSKIDLERAGGSVPDLDRKVRDMQSLGADAKVLTLISDLNNLPELPYKVIQEHAPSRTFFGVQWTVFKMLRKYADEADVFHIEGQYSYGGGLYRALGGKPVVIFYNRETFSWSPGNSARHRARHYFERLLNTLLVPHINHFIFTTPFLAARYKKFGLRVGDDRITIQPDYVDENKIKIKKQPSIHQGVRIFASGRMIPEKGFDLIIEAIAQLPKDVLAIVSATIGGEGPEKERLITLSKERGVEAHISFPGWVPKDVMYKTIADADVFILPKWQIELSSVILFEAMMIGLPVIVPRGGGLEWLAGEGAETFEDGSAESLAHAIRALSSTETRIKKGDASRARVAEFNHKKMAPVLFCCIKNAAGI